ncbi:MAG: DUF3473 domain-containing protein [Chitinophagaceae bacterium]|nr:DUF3473 domain-containing protein [Chitinophagaceae bacterium]
MSERNILLSFDVEEFDMPVEYGQNISMQEQLAIGKKGLDSISVILNDSTIQTTLFTTANFADHYPDTIKDLAKQHEIASHTYYHSSFSNDDIAASKNRLEIITGHKIYGLRMPRMQKVDMGELKKAEYLYDSSINPTWLPGRYNNIHLPRTLYTENEITRVPASVSPALRIPLFWLTFKNCPLSVFTRLAIKTLKKDGYLCLYFHPWEFTDISQYRLPLFTKRWSKEILLDRLTTLIADLKKEGDFISMNTFINKKVPVSYT